VVGAADARSKFGAASRTSDCTLGVDGSAGNAAAAVATTPAAAIATLVVTDERTDARMVDS
jgi:hypothetical protein